MDIIKGRLYKFDGQIVKCVNDKHAPSVASFIVMDDKGEKPILEVPSWSSRKIKHEKTFILCDRINELKDYPTNSSISS